MLLVHSFLLFTPFIPDTAGYQGVYGEHPGLLRKSWDLILGSYGFHCLLVCWFAASVAAPAAAATHPSLLTNLSSTPFSQVYTMFAVLLLQGEPCQYSRERISSGVIAGGWYASCYGFVYAIHQQMSSIVLCFLLEWGGSHEKL